MSIKSDFFPFFRRRSLRAIRIFVQQTLRLGEIPPSRKRQPIISVYSGGLSRSFELADIGSVASRGWPSPDIQALVLSRVVTLPHME